MTMRFDDAWLTRTAINILGYQLYQLHQIQKAALHILRLPEAAIKTFEATTSLTIPRLPVPCIIRKV